jgi:hypothetical protein
VKQPFIGLFKGESFSIVFSQNIHARQSIFFLLLLILFKPAAPAGFFLPDPLLSTTRLCRKRG